MRQRDARLMTPYRRHFEAYLAARASGDFEVGLRVARAAHGECPGEHHRTWLWQACMQSRRGDVAAAAMSLRAGLQEGAWWSPGLLEEEADLVAARGTAAFKEVYQECVRRFLDAQVRARPTCRILSPAGATWEQRTLLLLHGRGETAAEFSPCWESLLDKGWTLIVAQSSQPWDSGSFCWDDMDRARAEVREILSDCQRLRGLTTEGMAIAGASQGARLAIEAAHEAGVPWLAVIPSFPSGYDTAPLMGVPGRARGGFLLGENDPANALSRAVISVLEGAGVSMAVRVMNIDGHKLPDDLARQAGEMLWELFK